MAAFIMIFHIIYNFTALHHFSRYSLYLILSLYLFACIARLSARNSILLGANAAPACTMWRILQSRAYQTCYSNKPCILFTSLRNVSHFSQASNAFYLLI